MTQPDSSVAAVRLGPQAANSRMLGLLEEAAGVGGSAQRAVQLARSMHVAPAPGEGRTIELWELLASLGAVDLTVARVVEAHLDAVSILRQAAPTEAADGVWGVFAAEAPDVSVDAVGDEQGWRLTGTKPWCSVAGLLDSALITAHTPEGRRLFAIDLNDSGVSVDEGAWFARGLAELTSGPIQLGAVPAVPVGETGWYLSRPGFSWGAMGVAACWFGGAVGVARALVVARRADAHPIRSASHTWVRSTHGFTPAAPCCRTRRPPSTPAAPRARRGGSSPRGCAALSRTWSTKCIHRAGHALGPAPLSLDEEHARRVADLQLYVRQHHAERDESALGSAFLDSGAEW